MGDLEAELFGDFASGDEGAGDKPAASSSGEAAPKRDREGAAAEGERKPKRRKDVSKFYELEAEEAGGSGDEDEDGNLDDLIDDSGVPQGEKGRDRLRSQLQRQSELDELRREVSEREQAGESGASRSFGTSFLDKLEEKYKAMEEGEAAAAAAGVPAPASPALSAGAVKQTNAYVVPDPRDPKLWVVKTFGPEKALCIALMRKSAEWFATGKPVPIFSVFYSEHLRGFIYVEAFKESDVRDFCRGITGISQWDIKIVPIAQMPMVFTSSVVDADTHMMLKSGDWVRMKRGPYKGDLAQIDEVKDDLYVVKLKPRLRYGLEHQTKTDKSDKAHAKRPQPRWFNKADIEAGGLLVNTEKRFTPKGYLTFFIVDGESYRDGFLYKSFKAPWFDTGEHVRPLEHELQDWRFAPPINENTRPDVDLKKDEKKLMPPPSLPKKVVQQRSPLVEGDVVIVHSGDLKNLRGVVTQALFGASTVLVKPIGIANLPGELNISINLLSKYFEVGDYVKSIFGEHEGDTGYVLKVILDSSGGWGYNAMAKVLSSSINNEFCARVDHLRLTSQRPEPMDAMGEFAVGQLVRLEGRQNSRGLIVRLEAGTRAIVLCTDGTKHEVGFGDMEPVALPDRKMYSRTWTMDKKGKKIKPGAIVKCPRGSKGRTHPLKAEVLFIHNEFCFLKAVEALTGEKAYLVSPGNRCEFCFSVAEMNQEQREAQKEKTEQKGAQKTEYGVVMASETNWLQPWVKKMMGIQEERMGTPGSITTMGTAIRIHGGSYKGLRGEIRDHLNDKVRVSLLAKPKLVVVNISDIAPDDYELPKEGRFPTAGYAPGTPTVAGGASAPGTPFTPMSPLPDEEDKASEDKTKESGPGASESNNPSSEGARVSDSPVVAARASRAPDTARAPGGHAHTITNSPTEEVSTLQITRRRQPRLPPTAEPASASKAVATTSRQMSQSPSALFGQSVERGDAGQGSTDGRALWLANGVAIKYTRDGRPATGYIIKVYADTAHVVSSLADVGDDSEMHAVKGSETAPMEASKRGEWVYIFDGPRRGEKGKIVGVEKESLYVRVEHEDKGKHTKLFASAAGSDLVRIKRAHVAAFSRDWEQTTTMRRRMPPTQAAAPAGAPPPTLPRPWWEVDTEPTLTALGAVATSAAPTPNAASVHSPSSPRAGGLKDPLAGTGAALASVAEAAAAAAQARAAAAGAEGADGDEPMPPAGGAAAAAEPAAATGLLEPTYSGGSPASPDSPPYGPTPPGAQEDGDKTPVGDVP